jgi:hypothetical protein
VPTSAHKCPQVPTNAHKCGQECQGFKPEEKALLVESTKPTITCLYHEERGHTKKQSNKKYLGQNKKTGKHSAHVALISVDPRLLSNDSTHVANTFIADSGAT